ncbi:beta-1,4-N-acetylgalactosaminyltransferase bre-4-like isoform X2 [Varroa destructor]|uniref:Beta-1,4-N-acetylgalactosaminyltransferase n=1 Tax=Varroa destructor TaxID=109461 RepID=A0A7M7KC59_VARDE|nr:beta-1,4-N-acetylgalactosaminyltransferase bre-4-like isoform X2 [Varroa destructor]
MVIKHFGCMRMKTPGYRPLTGGGPDSEESLCRLSYLYKLLFLLVMAVLFVQYSSNVLMVRSPQVSWVVSEVVYNVKPTEPNNSSRGTASTGNETSPLSNQSRIKNETCAILWQHLNNRNSTLCSNETVTRRCPLIPPRLVGPMKVFTDNISFEDLEALHQDVELGGKHRPSECIARYKVAIIVPYREREEHLRKLLHNLHPMLKRQQLDYEIFVVEQNGMYRFNRAKLMNIGFLEASKLNDFECFIFHDVDLIPEDDRNLYSCPDQPRHMSVAVSTMKYKLPYANIFGGVSALSKKDMRTVNGFSNEFWGWGGEDDDMSARIRYHKLKITRYPASIARYKMLSHKKDTPNPERYRYLKRGRLRYRTDGINSCKYRVLNIVFKKLYTWILVDALPPQKKTK